MNIANISPDLSYRLAQAEDLCHKYLPTAAITAVTTASIVTNPSTIPFLFWGSGCMSLASYGYYIYQMECLEELNGISLNQQTAQKIENTIRKIIWPIVIANGLMMGLGSIPLLYSGYLLHLFIQSPEVLLALATLQTFLLSVGFIFAGGKFVLNKCNQLKEELPFLLQKYQRENRRFVNTTDLSLALIDEPSQHLDLKEIFDFPTIFTQEKLQALNQKINDIANAQGNAADRLKDIIPLRREIRSLSMKYQQLPSVTTNRHAKQLIDNIRNIADNNDFIVIYNRIMNDELVLPLLQVELSNKLENLTQRVNALKEQAKENEDESKVNNDSAELLKDIIPIKEEIYHLDNSYLEPPNISQNQKDKISSLKDDISKYSISELLAKCKNDAAASSMEIGAFLYQDLSPDEMEDILEGKREENLRPDQDLKNHLIKLGVKGKSDLCLLGVNVDKKEELVRALKLLINPAYDDLYEEAYMTLANRALRDRDIDQILGSKRDRSKAAFLDLKDHLDRLGIKNKKDLYVVGVLKKIDNDGEQKEEGISKKELIKRLQALVNPHALSLEEVDEPEEAVPSQLMVTIDKIYRYTTTILCIAIPLYFQPAFMAAGGLMELALKLPIDNEEYYLRNLWLPQEDTNTPLMQSCRNLWWKTLVAEVGSFSNPYTLFLGASVTRFLRSKTLEWLEPNRA